MQERSQCLDGNSNMKRVLLIQCKLLSTDKQNCQSLTVLMLWKGIYSVLKYCQKMSICRKTTQLIYIYSYLPDRVHYLPIFARLSCIIFNYIWQKYVATGASIGWWMTEKLTDGFGSNDKSVICESRKNMLQWLPQCPLISLFILPSLFILFSLLITKHTCIPNFF